MNMNEIVDIKEARNLLKDKQNLINDEIDSFVCLKNVNKVYPNGAKAVFGFNLEIKENEFVALVGPSGCGKSTTLRMIAGLEEITSGDLYINKVYSNYVPSKDRDIAMVFQSYALYPNKNVYDNIAFGLKIRHVDKKEIEKRVFEAADILDLGQYLDRYPKELSGGQMQRVALGRAIVRQAHIFLMDEPLSNLDAKLRVQMRSEIVRIHKDVKATTIYVTHDQTEAMTMADKIVVMNKGHIQQIGTPLEVYYEPENLFVATFIGSPSMNIIKAKYKNGKVYLNDDLEFDLGEDFKAKHNEFYYKKTIDLQAYLENIDDLSEDKLHEMMSHQIYVKGEKTIVYNKKEHFKSIKKLIKFIKNLSKKENNDEKLKKEQLIKEIFEKYLENSKKAINEEHEVLIGIRPEHFYKFNEFHGENSSNKFSVDVNMVELLGSEYIIHTHKFDADIQIKLAGSDKHLANNKTLEVCFDLSQVHVFDLDSGLTIK